MALHLYQTAAGPRVYTGPGCDPSTELADALARLCEQTPWFQGQVAYNPMTRELRVRFDGVWHVVTVREDS